MDAFDTVCNGLQDLAGYENRVETDLAVLKWMVGTNIVLTLAVFGLLGKFILH